MLRYSIKPWLLWCGLAISSLVLVGLHALEQQLPQLGVWMFIALSVTLGMGHGALDAVLLLGQFKPSGKALAYGLVYLLITIALAGLLSQSLMWALILLIAMSVWHFGENYAANIFLRLTVGAASVMAPVLLHSDVMASLLHVLMADQATALHSAWYALSWVWAAGAVGALAWWMRSAGSAQSGVLAKAVLEIGLVVIVFAALSPLLAFALYFGGYHCLAHIARVRRAVLKHQGIARGAAITVLLFSALLTAILMFLLWRYLHSALGMSNALSVQLLQWMIVVLAAVTLPHLLLVAYSRRWLAY